MEYDFRSASWFSGVLGCTSLAVGELGSDGAKTHWLLLLILLSLLIAIWLSLVLIGLGCLCQEPASSVPGLLHISWEF